MFGVRFEAFSVGLTLGADSKETFLSGGGLNNVGATGGTAILVEAGSTDNVLFPVHINGADTDLDDSGTDTVFLFGMSYGADDSGGSGFKYLRVPNAN